MERPRDPDPRDSELLPSEASGQVGRLAIENWARYVRPPYNAIQADGTSELFVGVAAGV